MNILEIFAGSRSVGKEAEKLSIRVFSTDIEPFEKIDAVTDIRKLQYNQIPFIPDVIWASRPCTTFSILSCRFPWRKEGSSYTCVSQKGHEGMVLVKRTLQIIRYYQKKKPTFDLVCRKPERIASEAFTNERPTWTNTVTYCQYGDM